MSKTIRPIKYVTPGQCLNCKHNTLVLIQKDIDVIFINNDGTMGKNENIRHESKLFCTNCNSEFDYEKRGFVIKPVSKEQLKKKEIKSNKDKYIIKNPFTGDVYTGR